MKDVVKLIATTTAGIALIAGATYFAILKQWIGAAMCGGTLIMAYLYYTISHDSTWTVFRLDDPNEPDHPELPGQDTSQWTSTHTSGFDEQHRG